MSFTVFFNKHLCNIFTAPSVSSYLLADAVFSGHINLASGTAY